MMKRFKHNLSYYNLASADMGKLVPVGLTEVLPGDTIQHHTNALIRVSPLAAPVMHNVTARIHHFFVPHRLTWDGFEDFITGGPDGNNADQVPRISVTNAIYDVFQLYDYLGIPKPDATNTLEVSALPIRAYNLIFNEFYRDEDLVPELPESNAVLADIAWEKDYFTTARPWTQKGPEVTVPVAGQAPVKGLGVTGNSSSVNQQVKESDGETRQYTNAWHDATSGWYINDEGNDEFPNVFADLTQAEAVNVNEFRKAFALQRYQEARARYGSRYTEYLRYLGVRPKDERLQRPEFLGGGQAQIQFSEVLQTGPETGQQPSTEFGVGDLYGHGISAMRSNAYRRTMEEHGYVMTLLSVRPKTLYMQSMDRTWLRRDKEDFFQKELQHIGQQEIKVGEIYGPTADDEQATWGYQDRYAEYRQNFSKVAGEFRNVLNYWHMGRDFEVQPVLNQSFIQCDATKRIHNEQTKHALWCMVQHRMVAKRLVDRSAAPRIY